MKVLSFGEILFDIIEGENYLGGAPLNVAAHLAQCGVDSYIFSNVGEDELGKLALKQIQELGVNTTFVKVDKKYPTGTVEVELNQGQPDYTICEQVAYDFITLRGQKEELDKVDFEVLYYGTLAQRNQESREALGELIARKSFRHVFYDVNLRKGFYSEEILRESLRNCTILKLNDEEVEVLSELLYQQDLGIEAFAEKTAESFGVEIVIITAGEQGCYIYENNKLHFVPGHSVTVADTVGAGDAFSAAFLFKYLNGAASVEAARAANKLGAYVASFTGPIPAYSPEIKKSLGIEKKTVEV